MSRDQIVLDLGRPNPKQAEFFRSKNSYVGYGGARGGGKSWALRVKAILLALHHPGIIIMIIRRSYPELTANHIKPLKKMIPNEIARYNDSKKEFKFANGSEILFRYCATAKDLDNFQGTEADIIMIDEATHFDEDTFKMIDACRRGVNNFPKRMYVTCNPGGKGHAWVKRLFIDRHYTGSESPADYSFIQAKVYDNKALMDEQPQYISQLEHLPPKLRQAWLEGSWDIYEGQFFEEFTDNPDGYATRTWTHVIPAFKPDRGWRFFRSFDFGYAKPFSCGWWAMDYDGILYRILELYGCVKDMPNEGVKWSPDKIFREIARVEREHPYLQGVEVEGIADPSIWDRSRGESIAEMAAREGVYFEPGDNKRIPGWMQMHYRMAFDEHGIPMMYVFENCHAFIRTVPALIYDEHKPEDLDTSMEDHVADEVRYICMANPLPPIEVVEQKQPEYDPLDLWK